MEYILKTHDLTKKYGETLAVNAVNMTIERGDIYGCVGENGAGKSTLIRLITGIAKPTRGSFQLFKQDRLGAVAAVVETPALHLSLSRAESCPSMPLAWFKQTPSKNKRNFENRRLGLSHRK